MKNKLLVTMLAIVIIMMIIPMMSVTASEVEDITIDYTTPTKQWTDSTRPGSKLSYNAEAKTLTMENWIISGSLKITTWDNSTGLFTIILKGDNVISGVRHGIEFSGHNETVLRITSESRENAGTLTVSASTSAEDDYSAGIYMNYAHLEVSGGVTVTTTGGKISDMFGVSAGIYAQNGVTVKNATLYSYGGECPDNNTYGIYGGDSKITISGSAVYAYGGIGSYSKGTYSASMDINADSFVYARGGNAAGGSFGIDVYEGNLLVKNNVNLIAIGGAANESISVGIRARGRVIAEYTASVITAIGGFAKRESIGIQTEGSTSSVFSCILTCVATPGASSRSQGFYPTAYNSATYEGIDYSVRTGNGIDQTSEVSIADLPSRVHIGDSFRLTASGGSGSGVYLWQTSDASIATVDQEGNVSVRGAGSVTLTVRKTADGTYKEATKSITFNAVCEHTDSEHTTATNTADGTHNFICTVCEATVSEECSGGEANCVSGKICDSCNTEYGEINSDNHKTEAYNLTSEDNSIIALCVHCTAERGKLTLSSDPDNQYTGHPVNALIDKEGVLADADVIIEYNTSDGEAPVDIGSYTASVTYKDETVSVGHSIEKATPKTSDFVFTPPADLVYNGEEKSAYVTVSSGIEGMGDITVKYFKIHGFAVDTPVNAGIYFVKIDVAEGENYLSVTDLDVGVFDINQREIGEDDVNISETEVTYNGNRNAPVITVNGLELDRDFTVKWDDPSLSSAGIYTATVEGTGNYSGTVYKTFIINRKKLEVKVISPIGTILPGNTVLLTVESNSTELPIPTVTVNNGTNNGLKVTAGSALVIGQDSVTVTVSYATTANYTEGSDTVTLDVGMSDFSGDISALEERIDALDEIYATDDALRAEIDALKDSVTDLANADTKTAEEISDLRDRITAIENAYAAKSDLDAAVARLDELTRDGGTLDQINAEIKKINDALVVLDAENRLTLAEKALDTLINTTVPGLNELISDNAENISANAADIALLKNNVADINSTLSALDAEDERLAQLISALDSELLALSDALSALTDRVDVAEENIDALEGAVAELDAALKKDAQDLKDAIDALNTAIDNARSALEKADADNKKILEKAIADAKTNLDYAIEQVAKALEDTDKRLSDAMAKGDSDLSDRINALKAELDAAISAYKAADESMKKELSLKIESADKTLGEAIKAVQKNLDDAKASLEGAIAELDAAVKKGDADLKAEIAAVNSALANARSALEKADADNKAELTAALDSAEKALTAAIEAVQKNLSDTKTELEKLIADNRSALDARDSDLNTFIIIVCVISSLSLAGTATFVIWFFVSKKR